MPRPFPISVSTLWRYPVKSMMGEELNASSSPRRRARRPLVRADRQGDSKVVSAKNPRNGRTFSPFEPPMRLRPAPLRFLRSGSPCRRERSFAATSPMWTWDCRWRYRAPSPSPAPPSEAEHRTILAGKRGKSRRGESGSRRGDAPVGTFSTTPPCIF